jgi:hypothetical protein
MHHPMNEDARRMNLVRVKLARLDHDLNFGHGDLAAKLSSSSRDTAIVFKSSKAVGFGTWLSPVLSG